ncbi:MAG: PD-(D/E)XK nuclease family protein, partial [Bacteroidales bacterium]|nr:PD-(D/E)XK nuclease family protein [Bacteroidales bacterium]
TLHYDMAYAPFTYLDGESTVKADLDAGGVTVMLKGIIDRLDSKEGTGRIVDYKTGSMKLHGKRDNDAAMLDKMFNVDDPNNRPSTSLQMVLYAYLKARKDTGTLHEGALGSRTADDMDLCVYQLKEMFKADLWTFGSNDKLLRDFEERLATLVNEIFSPGEFVARPNERKCEYCPVRVLCNN